MKTSVALEVARHWRTTSYHDVTGNHQNRCSNPSDWDHCGLATPVTRSRTHSTSQINHYCPGAASVKTRELCLLLLIAPSCSTGLLQRVPCLLTESCPLGGPVAKCPQDGLGHLGPWSCRIYHWPRFFGPMRAAYSQTPYLCASGRGDFSARSTTQLRQMVQLR